MLSDRRYRNAATGSFIGILGMVVVCVTLLVSSLIPGCSELNQEIKTGIQNDPRPANQLINYTHPDLWVDTVK
tara:strand:- start:2426 stop:2644 length:219 start_codon:yes stop_codon:yes gene_type:complete